MLINHFLEDSAARLPDKVALIHEDVRATYAQINTKANQLARWLVNQGVTKGDRVVIVLENCLEYVISYYAILKAGAVVAPLSSDIKPDGLSHLLEELEPKVVISSSRFERLLNAIDLTPFKIHALIIRAQKLKWTSVPPPVFPWEDIIGDEESSNPDILIHESALASIIYTSGSTGKPKGVMLSHGNIVSNTHSANTFT
jgi:acyl-CoA synthetase (AMP-forming)/AMP-acid ligase II